MFSSPKVFSEELQILLRKLKSKENFAFSKFADGEYSIIRGMPIDNNEFKYELSKEQSEARVKLIESFTYLEEDYYVGISCPCCAGIDALHMRDLLYGDGRTDKDTTFANIFVNSNYQTYVEQFIPEYEKRKILLVANRHSKISNLPFRIAGGIGVGHTAYLNHQEHTSTMLDLTRHGGYLVLLACGPLGNIMAHKGWENNKKNTYLDIGSTLNPWLQSEGFKRHYYEGINAYSQMVCRW